MKAIIQFTLNYPKSVIGSIVLVSILLASFIPRLVPEPDFREWLPHDHEAVAYDDLVREEFGVRERIMIGMVSDGEAGIFQPELLRLIADLSDEIGSINGVLPREVRSISTEKDIRGTEEGMEVRRFMKEVPQTEKEIESLREAVLANDIYAGYIVSRDANASLLVAEVKDYIDNAKLYHEVKRLVDRFQTDGIDFFIGGRPVLFGEVSNLMLKDLGLLTVLIIVLVVVVLFSIFRTTLGFLIPLLVVIASVVWCFGIMGAVGAPLYPLFSMLPVLLIAIGCADGIHILSRYYEGLGGVEDKPKRQIIFETMEEMWIPVAATSITTSIGFLSLLTAPLPPLKLFGVFAAVGILAAMVFSLTFIPAVLIVMPTRCPAHYRSRRPGAAGPPTRLRLPFRRLGGLFFDHRGVILVVISVLVVLFGLGLARLEVDSSYTQNTNPDTDLVRTTRYLDQHFGGTNMLNVIVEGEEPDAMKSPSILKKMLILQKDAESMPMVGETLSIAEFVKRMNFIMNANDPSQNRIPDNRDLIAQYLLLYSISGDPDDFDEYVDYEYRRANVHIQIRTDHSKDVDEVIEGIESIIEREFHDEPVRVKLAGWANNLKVAVELITIGQVRSLVLGLLMVFVITAASFRSVRAGIFAVTPVSLALLINFGTMGYKGITIGIATALISSIALGVGIDYAIHYYAKYRRLSIAGRGARERAVETMATCGRAIFYNALVVSAGFLVLLLSNFRFTQNLGVLVCVSMMACFVATVMILPILLGRWRP